MPFIDNDGVQVFKGVVRGCVTEHYRQAFWCGNQRKRWFTTLTGASALASISGANFNPDISLQCGSSMLQLFAGVGCQCSQWRYPKHL